MDNRHPALNIQDAFFNQARRERTRVTVHLSDGRTLRGRIKGFDRFALLLENGDGELMIYKHAISTLSAARAFGNTIDLDSAAVADGSPRKDEARGAS